jgi:aspartate/methionine/tyrosine aminotransferase
MFSERTSWSFAANRLANLLADKRGAGEEVLDLTESNPTRAGLDYPEAEILGALRDRNALLYEPTPFGLEKARNAVTQYYLDRGKKVSPDDILLTASTSEAYSFLFKVLLDPGDRILIPRPSYPLFDYLAVLESLDVVSYPLDFDGTWSLDTNALEEAIVDRTRTILVVHPGNPTGSYLQRDEIKLLLNICRRHRLHLIIDEVFFDYVLEENRERIDSLAGEQSVLTFVLSGLSKVAGLPQMKLSWIWMGGPDPTRLEARQRLEHVSDIFLSVGSPIQHALDSYLKLAEQIQTLISTRLSSNLAFLRDRLSDSPVDALPVGGGWYAILRLPAVRSSEEWALTLLSLDDVYVHPGYLFDLPMGACLVASLLTPQEHFREGIQRILQRVVESTDHDIDRRR